jgi:hypothetical protein
MSSIMFFDVFRFKGKTGFQTPSVEEKGDGSLFFSKRDFRLFIGDF